MSSVRPLQDFYVFVAQTPLMQKLITQFQEAAYANTVCDVELIVRQAEKEIVKDFIDYIKKNFNQISKEIEKESEILANLDALIQEKKDTGFEFHIGNGTCLINSEADFDLYYKKTMIFGAENEAVNAVIRNLLNQYEDFPKDIPTVVGECAKFFTDNLDVQEELTKYGDVAGLELLKNVLGKSREFLVINDAEISEEDKIFIKIVCCKGGETSLLAKMLSSITENEEIFFVDNGSSKVIEFLIARVAIPPYAVKSLVCCENSYKSVLIEDKRNYGVHLVHTSDFAHLLPSLTPLNSNSSVIDDAMAKGKLVGRITSNGKWQYKEDLNNIIELGMDEDQAKDFLLRNQFILGKVLATYVRRLEENPVQLQKDLRDIGANLGQNKVRFIADEIEKAVKKNGKSKS